MKDNRSALPTVICDCFLLADYALNNKTEAEIQLQLKRFPDSSVFSLI